MVVWLLLSNFRSFYSQQQWLKRLAMCLFLILLTFLLTYLSRTFISLWIAMWYLSSFIYIWYIRYSQWSTMLLNSSLQSWGKGSHSNQVLSGYSPRIIKVYQFPTTAGFMAALGCCCWLDWFDLRAVYNIMENCLQQMAFLGLAQDLGLHSGTGTRQETFWGFSFL